MKRTPLYSAHQKLGGKLIEFGGWEMPVQYTGIVDEHLAVRAAAGVFDISHMGEALVSGAAAPAFLNHVLTNDVLRLEAGGAQYSLMCNERGGVIDDLYVYRLGADSFLLIINASRIEPDIQWLTQQAAAFPQRQSLKVEDVSDRTGAIAIQGPNAVRFVDPLVCSGAVGGTPVRVPGELKKNQMAGFKFAGQLVYVARTGYTGEDGFEIVAPAEQIEAVWCRALELGRDFGIKPAGLGARDTLRTEMCYPLYGHELDEDTTPIEAGLGYFVALDKGDFIGRAVMAAQKASGPGRKLVAFRMTEKSPPPRPHYFLFGAGAGAARIGEATSGTQSPSLGLGIGLGYVAPAQAKSQTPLQVEIRGRRFAAVVVPKPIYRKAVDPAQNT